MNGSRCLLRGRIRQSPASCRIAGLGILLALFLSPVYAQQPTAATGPPDDSQAAATSASTPDSSTSVSAASKALAEGAMPDAPLASTATVSLVEVSPSTEMRL